MSHNALRRFVVRRQIGAFEAKHSQANTQVVLGYNAFPMSSGPFCRSSERIKSNYVGA